MSERKKPQDTGKQIVGYRKPPVHSRFRKGQSGNPGGRPKGMTLGRAAALALKEAYRPVRVKEGDKVKVMPAMQVMLRKQVDLAINGNGPALRACTEMIRAIESELAALAAPEAAAQAEAELVSDTELARWIAFTLSQALKEREVKEGQSSQDNSHPNKDAALQLIKRPTD